jgi:hypothetical protein
MTKDKTKLTAFTLKLSDEDRYTMKLICAVDKAFRYQYQLLDAAVLWAIQNRERIVAIANPKDGGNRSYYLSETVSKIEVLENEWNCNTTRALYTAVVHYLKHCEEHVLTDHRLNEGC